MRSLLGRDMPAGPDTEEYLRLQEEAAEEREHIMRQYFNQTWPKRFVLVLAVFELLITLAILAVDLPIMLMYAPRWQVLVGCWMFVAGVSASIASLSTLQKITMRKLEIAAGINTLATLAGILMTILDIIFAANPYACLIPSGCNYLSYTYSVGRSFYIGEIVLGVAFIATTVTFLIVFGKYGMGAKSNFHNIQRGYGSTNFNPIGPPSGFMPKQRPGPGYMMNRAQRPGFMPRYPGQAPRGMMGRPPNPMMMSGPRGPMMPLGPRAPIDLEIKSPEP